MKTSFPIRTMKTADTTVRANKPWDEWLMHVNSFCVPFSSFEYNLF